MNRPRPPQSLLDINAFIERGGYHAFAPAPEIVEWLRTHILSDTGAIYNADHDHLHAATIGALWTDAENSRQGKTVLAQAEIFTAKGNKWTIARQEYQLREWFDGEIPTFILTFSAGFAAQWNDATWCAVVEHELYHCRQARDPFGMPKFRKDGKPVFCLVGHDVEEFSGVVRRYGLEAVAPEVSEFVAAANGKPLIEGASIAGACGTCLRLV